MFAEYKIIDADELPRDYLKLRSVLANVHSGERIIIQGNIFRIGTDRGKLAFTLTDRGKQVPVLYSSKKAQTFLAANDKIYATAEEFAKAIIEQKLTLV